MNDERLWQLIIQKFTGEAGPEDLAELETLLKQHSELGFQLGILEEVWRTKQYREPIDTNDHFNRHLQRLSNHLAGEQRFEETIEQPRSKQRWLFPAIAASILVVISILLYNKPNHTKPVAKTAQNLVSTRNGSKTKLQLPDGSEVWLNAGSKISYSNDFTERRATLNGEAFFEVVKDSTRPFIIHTDAVDIKVLGTAFNVRSYPDEKVTETSLIHGAVEITVHKNPGKKIVLKPHEKLIVKNDTSAQKITRDEIPLMTLTQVHYVNEGKDSASMETLWTKNKLAFDGETLQQVAQKLERWYGVQVTIQSDKLKNTEYTAVFEDENINEVLYALQLSGNFNYTIKKKEVIIKP